jgi:hypothetical protein
MCVRPAASLTGGSVRDAGRTTQTVMTQHSVVPPGSGTGTRAPVPSTDVEAWRLRRLVDAGFPLRLALELAATPGVDLHALLALLDRGCPPELAARILAPIDGTEGRP